MSTFEVIRGVEGCCLALDDTRIAGPKPWGGGTAIYAWETDKTYKVVDEHNRWFELFGTLERAARTLRNICNKVPDCGVCQIRETIGEQCNYDALLKWLRGDEEE